MLEKQINGFIEYCKVSGFKDRSIQSLSINLKGGEPGSGLDMGHPIFKFFYHFHQCLISILVLSSS